MMWAYQKAGPFVRAAPMPPSEDALNSALWIDLYRPTAPQVAALARLGIAVPSVEEMAEIQPSRRLRREGATLWVTVVLPGLEPDGTPTTGPVALVVGPDRLVTVRHHDLPAFAAYAQQGADAAMPCDGPSHVAVGLVEQVVGGIADLLEESGDRLDALTEEAFERTSTAAAGQHVERYFHSAFEASERLSRARHSLLTLERALAYVVAARDHGTFGTGAADLGAPIAAIEKDIQAMADHCDYLASRASALGDAALGLIDLTQSRSFSVLSSVTALFVPPTLIASIYGMNFADMPELVQPWGYELALAAMGGSVLCAFALLRWKKLL